MVNLNLTTPGTFPIFWAYGGQEYEIASVSGLGCADTVYSTTYNGTAYVAYTPLTPLNSLTVIADYSSHTGIANIACSSLVTNAQYQAGNTTTGTSSDVVFLGMDLSTGTGIVEFMVFLAVVIIGVGILYKLAMWLFDGGKRR